MSMDSLCPSILQEIFQWSPFHDFLAQSQVCESWRSNSRTVLPDVVNGIRVHLDDMEVSENFLKREERLLRLHTDVPQEEFRHLVRLQLWCTEQCRCSNLEALPLRDIVRFLLMYTEVRNFVGMHSVVIDALLADINVRARVQSQDISLMICTWFTGLFVCNSMDNIVEMLKHMAFPGYCLMLRLFERRESGRPIILPRFVHQSL